MEEQDKKVKYADAESKYAIEALHEYNKTETQESQNKIQSFNQINKIPIILHSNKEE